MKSFLSLSTSSATAFHFRPLMAKLQSRAFLNYPAFYLSFCTTRRNCTQCSQLKLRRDGLSSITSINHSQNLTNGWSMYMSMSRYIAKTLYGDDEEEETPQDTNDTNVDETKLLDVHPTSDEKVLLKKGPYGFYVQLGEDRTGCTLKRSSVSHIKDMDAIALEVALDLLRYPQTLGDHPKDGNPVILKIGRVGYMVKHRQTMASVPKDVRLEKANVGRSGQPKSKPKVKEAVEARESGVGK